jgi:hypothetical protein
MKSAFAAVMVDLAQFVAETFLPQKRRQKQRTGSLQPHFDTRTQYYAANQETLKLRLLISSYDKEKLLKPLTAREFILYRLKDIHLTVSNEDILLSEGFLHDAVKGSAGVYTSIIPKRNAVMEIFDEEQQSKLLFVDNVFGDESIEVESVGLYTIGEFRYDVFTKNEWLQWRPVFISFSSSI